MTKKIAAALRSLTRRRFFPVMMAALAIAAGMLLPSAVLSVQSAHLEKADTLISTGISSGRQSSETAKLDIISRFHSAVINGSGEELPLSRGRFMTAGQAEGLLPELESILASAGIEYTAPPDYAERLTEPFLMVLDDGSGMTSAIFWIVHFYWDNNELCFVVDDETGIILSGYGYRYDYNDGSLAIAEEPYGAQDYDVEQLAAAQRLAQRLADALCESYGFENVSAEAEPDVGYMGFRITFIRDGKPACSTWLAFEADGWHFGM